MDILKITDFRLVPTSVTLNDLYGVKAHILRYFTESDYVTVVQDRFAACHRSVIFSWPADYDRQKTSTVYP